MCTTNYRCNFHSRACRKILSLWVIFAVCGGLRKSAKQADNVRSIVHGEFLALFFVRGLFTLWSYVSATSLLCSGCLCEQCKPRGYVVLINFNN